MKIKYYLLVLCSIFLLQISAQIQTPKELAAAIEAKEKASMLYAAQRLSGGGLPITLTSPEQDCNSAIPVCQNVYSTSASYSGYGVTQEIPGNSCLGSNELNSVWYTFTSSSSGNIAFNITPNVLGQDYDFALYNITGTNCSAINSGALTPIRCNFSATGGVTGLSSSGTNASEPASGSNQSTVLSTAIGQTYVLIISNYSSSANGYQLNFTPGTASIFDVTPPTLTSVSAPCGSNVLTLNTSEQVTCASIASNGSDISISGTGGPYTISGASGVNCGSSSAQITFTISPALTGGGPWVLNAHTGSDGNSFIDNCGNAMPTTTVSFNVSPATPVITGPTTVCKGSTFALSSSSAVSYTWTGAAVPAGQQNLQTLSITANSAGTLNFQLAVSYGACGTATVNKSVTVTDAPIANFTALPSLTVCAGTVVTFTNTSTYPCSTGGLGLNQCTCGTLFCNSTSNQGTFATYLWTFGDGGTAFYVGGSPASAFSPTHTYASAGSYNISLTASGLINTCSNIKNLAITVLPAMPNLTVSPSVTICPAQSTTLSVSGGSSYTWTPGATLSSTSNSVTVATPVTTTIYSVSAPGCGSTQTGTVQVTVGGTPPAIGAINGSSLVCPNTTGVTYSVANIASTNYTWLLPAGASITSTPTNSNAITVNFGASVGTISVTAVGACGTATASINVGINLSLTANPSACNTNLYSLTGSITFANAPTTGSLVVGTACGGQQVFTAPFTSPTNYTISGLAANGATCAVGAGFSASSSCSNTVIYTAPVTCSTSTICNLSVTVNPSSCNPSSNSYSVAGTISFANAPTTGSLIVGTACGGSQVFIAPFVSPLNYSITNLVSNGSSCSVNAGFSASSTCSNSVSYTAPSSCTITATPTTVVTYTFVFTGVVQSFTVPCSVSSVHVKAWGGGGSGGGNDSYPGAIGGGGGFIESDIATTPNQVLTAVIGGGALGGGSGGNIPGGAGGFGFGLVDGGNGGASGPQGGSGSGGGGGAGSALFTGTTPLIVAAGGGGGSGGGQFSSGGAGGAGGQNGFPAGGSGCTSPGIFGSNGNGNGIPGVPKSSGDGGGGGGGGGGYLGGGGGGIASGCDCGACGGGGGSSFSSGTGITIIYSSGSNVGNPTDPDYIAGVGMGGNSSTKGGDGFIIVTYTAAISPTITVNSGSICLGQQSQTLTTTGATTYSWTPALGLSSTTGSLVVANPSVTSTYTVIGTSGNGCTDTAVSTITVRPLPILSTTSNSLCAGNSASISVSGANTYSWIPSNTLNSSTNATVSANPTTTTTYSVIGMDVNTCLNAATATVTVFPIPTLTITPSYSICSGTSGSLTVSGATTYTWNASPSLSSTSNSMVICTPNATETYTVIGELNTCTISAVSTITVITTPTLTVNTSSAVVCPAGTASLTVTGATNYTWSPTATLSSSTGSLVVASPANTSTYTVIGAISTCTNTNQVVVTVTTTPVITATSATICSTASASLTANGGVTYTWSPATNLNMTSGSTVISTPPSSINYNVSGSSALGCIGSTSLAVVVIPTPTISITGNPLTICTGSTSVLVASGATAYTWSPTTTNPTAATTTASPANTTTYTANGTNGSVPNICTSTKTIEIIVRPKIVPMVSPNDVICFGQSTTIYATGGNTYHWNPTTGVSKPNDSTTIVKPTVQTIYTVTVSKNNLCPVTATVLVDVNPLPIIDAGKDTTINIDETYVLNGTGNVPVGFLSPDGVPLICNWCPIVEVQPTVATCYTLEGFTSFGCRNTDDVCITITKFWDLFIPNAFTPNGDFTNDYFMPQGYGLAQINMSIFDRWGAVIFKEDNTKLGWDGKYKGALCPQGVYVYRIETKSLGGVSSIKTGHLTVLPK